MTNIHNQNISWKCIHISFTTTYTIQVNNFHNNLSLLVACCSPCLHLIPSILVVNKVVPVLAVEHLEDYDVMLDVEEATRLGVVDDLVEGVGFSGGKVNVQRGIASKAEVGVGKVVAVGLVLDVLNGEAVLLHGRGVVGGEWGCGLRLGLDGHVGGPRWWVV